MDKSCIKYNVDVIIIGYIIDKLSFSKINIINLLSDIFLRLYLIIWDKVLSLLNMVLYKV